MDFHNGRFWARRAFDPELGVVDGIFLEWRDGIIERVEPAAWPPADCVKENCYRDHLLTPGFLNAHAHLDYSFLKGQLPRGQGFVPWLRGMIQARRTLRPQDEARARYACVRAIEDALREGLTEIWDTSSFGWACGAVEGSAFPLINFEELIAPDPSAWEAGWRAWVKDFQKKQFDFVKKKDGIKWGFSPHAAYTVCPPALTASCAWAGERRLPISIHLAESPEENEWLINGRGDLLEYMKEIARFDIEEAFGTGTSPVERAWQAGALGLATLAIHANLPQPGEAQLLAESQTGVVFCPLSHKFFGYPPYPLDEYRRAGVRLALGTDSMASNESLSMRAETRALADLAHDWSPQQILACATGAMLGDAAPFGARGQFIKGNHARWTLWKMPSQANNVSAEALLNAILDERTELETSSAF